MRSARSLHELFSMPRLSACATLTGVFGDRYARVVSLRRRKERPSVRSAATAAAVGTTSAGAKCAICRRVGSASTWSSTAGWPTARGAAACAQRAWTDFRRVRATHSGSRYTLARCAGTGRRSEAKAGPGRSPCATRSSPAMDLWASSRDNCHLSLDSVPRFRVIGSQAFSPDREPPVFAR